MGYFVQFSYTPPDRKGLQKGIAYISHREEGLPGGRTRTLYGIGDRYKALRGDEAAIIRQLWDDRRNLRSPVYYRAKLTIDDQAARRLLSVPEQYRERVIRDAVDRTFRTALRHSQGVYVIHLHGGASRPYGHPHVHVRLSPALANGRRFFLRPERLAIFKRTWEREVQRSLDRAIDRAQAAPSRESQGFRSSHSRRRKGSARRAGLDLLRPLLRTYAPTVANVVTAGERARSAARSPRRGIKSASLRLATRALPAPLRAGLAIARMFGRRGSED
jgi:hypothetical protein